VAVYERTYRPYAGPLTPSRWRFMVLPSYAIREVLRTRLLFAYLMACCIVPLGCAVMIYLPYNSTFLQTVLEQMGGGIPAFFDWNPEQFYTRFMIPQFFFAFFLVFLIGPAIISADMRNNALALYFSRPFNRWEYLLGKSLVLLLLVSAITWVPGILLFLLKGYLAGDGWFVDNLRLGVAIVSSWLICILVMTLISLAISAYVKWKPIARLGLFFLYIVAAGFGTLLSLTLKTKWGMLFNIAWDFNIAGRGMFGLPRDVLDIPPAAAWIVLVLVCLICVFLLQRKVRAYEVVRG
jgi:ABC-2 type transport system permease protein